MSSAVGITTIGGATAGPPQPATDENGLTENETATLWSRDADDYMGQDAYRRRYGERRSAIQQLANGTDITFTRPPATAATWTRHDFDDLQAGGSHVSVYPPHATLEEGRFIVDAHATVFALHPSTRGHLAPGETPLYIAPAGRLRGLIDYRIRVPATRKTDTRRVEWTLVDHDIEVVRLKDEGTTIATVNGTHTPEIPYQLTTGRGTTLTLEAEITVRLRKRIRIDHGNWTEVEISHPRETLTVSDSLSVEIYDLRVAQYYAAYPGGDVGVAILQTRPWHGYTLTANGTDRIRGVWRFYTARDTAWDHLVRSNRSHDRRVASDAIPVYVHAYPSRIGPRVEPVRTGPEIIDTWGTRRSSPSGTIGENVITEVVTRPYSTTYGVFVRADSVDRTALRVTGIVRGETATITEPEGGAKRHLRRSNLTIAVINRTTSQATLRLTLRDNETGAPIVLTDTARRDTIGGTAREGYITIGDRRLDTNASGVAIVTIDQSGIYTARYHPGTWFTHDPAYVSDSATVRWHPLGTINGWFAFLFELGWQLLPFAVVFYAGHRLLLMLAPEHLFRQ